MKRVLALLALLAAPLGAEMLEPIAPATNGTQAAIDRDTLRPLPPLAGRRRFAVTQVWVVYDYTKVRRDAFRDGRALLSFNCAARTSAMLAQKKYKRDGSRFYDWVGIDIDFKYKPVDAGTQTDAVMQRVCGFAPPPATPIVAPEDRDE